MSDQPLPRPVFLRTGKHLVQEIATLNDAIAFLSDWPERDRDIIHETAFRACIDAHDGLRPIAAAMNAIEGFARRKGILEDPAEVMPWINAAARSGGRMPA